MPPYLYANAMVTYEEPTKLTTMAMITAQNSRRFSPLITSLIFRPLATDDMTNERISECQP